jgi:serine phosphatase RsbU (regulator of sigma subunit)
MKWFYNIFQTIILMILTMNPLLYIFFWEEFSKLDDTKKIIIFFVIILIEFWIIVIIVKKFFHDPIIKLEYTIKSFLVWNLKDTNIEFKKTINPHLNYAMLFFAKTLNTLKNIKDEFIHGKEIRWEVEIGKEIQWKMLTKKLIEIPWLDVIVKSKPAWEIGWDSYDIINEWDNYYIYVWDATGHWVWAWFIMIMVNALISWFSKVYKSWALVLSKTNEILKPRVKANLLMSLLLIRWDNKEKRLFMTWAWHEYLMIYKHKQNKTFRIKSSWVALWMTKDVSKIITEKEIQFEENDIIILYSDWITEAINKSKKDWTEEMFWENRLEDSINNAPNVNNKNYKTSRSVFNNITIELSKFMWYKHTQLDDVTLAVIHYKWTDFDPKMNFPEEIPNDFITERNW